MKKTTTSIETKLGRYSAVAGALVAGTAVNAQVVYTDVNPDVVVNVSTPYALDFNNDGTSDMTFAVSFLSGTFPYGSYTVDYAGNVALFAGSFVGNGSTAFSYPAAAALAAGVPVDNAAAWATGTSGVGIMGYDILLEITAIGFSTVQAGGDWLGVNDQFVGARFQAGGNTHYGWVRCSVAADAATITIKDYAFQATPNCAINTNAQTGAACSTGLEDVELENKVLIRNNFEFATVNVTPDLIGGKLVFTNMMGQEILSQVISDVNTQVDFNNMASGIYMLSAQFEDGQVTKKVYVR